MEFLIAQACTPPLSEHAADSASLRPDRASLSTWSQLPAVGRRLAIKFAEWLAFPSSQVAEVVPLVRLEFVPRYRPMVPRTVDVCLRLASPGPLWRLDLIPIRRRSPKRLSRALVARYVRRTSDEVRSSVQVAAHAQSLPCELLLSLVLQESQFYHGGRLDRVCTIAFLLARELPVRALKTKSFGVSSLKPKSATRLIHYAFGQHVSERQAAWLVATSASHAIWLAAVELRRLKDMGASDAVAFLAYAATPATAKRLLRDPSEVLSSAPAFERRLADFHTYQSVAANIYAGSGGATSWLNRRGPLH